ncbi:MAG: 1-acyl-sn-glycerol-3-phosphate acyltransferase [Acidobacteria bacterium]|nr:1-acyl-sn-glycerol-3-phosphate acyltransferase [Acidobacteriota bacterium]
MLENSPTTKENKLPISDPLVVEYPTSEEMSVLGTTENIGFRITHRMNIGRWKRFWGFCQRHIGSLWIKICTYNLMNVYGIENVENSDPERPLLLVANHRSFFDMYVVSSVIFRQTRRPIRLFFPVRGKFFYNNPIGWFVNLVMGWWSMYPPFFREAKEGKKREFDKYSLRRLIQICRSGKAHVIGFHPEGKRHLSESPYDFARAQPGVGKIVMDANPQVIPIFIAGLGNDLPKQILGNWTGGEKVRVWFGEEIDFSLFDGERNSVRTHKRISDFIMEKIAELGEKDRNLYENLG